MSTPRADAAEGLPIHPETIEGDPATLRWVVPAGRVPFVGAVSAAPGALGDLLTDATITGVTCEAAGVLITLAPGRSWRVDGERVRSALRGALTDPAGWRAADGSPASIAGGPESTTSINPPPCDDDLAVAARAALAGAAGDYVRSHGGKVSLVQVRDGVAFVRLAGSCGDCPASAWTIQGRLDRDLRAEVTGLKEVRRARSRVGSLLRRT